MKRHCIIMFTVCLLTLCMTGVVWAGSSTGGPSSDASSASTQAALPGATPVYTQEAGTDAGDLSETTFKVKASAAGANTKVSWKKAEGATFYRVWRSAKKNGKKTLLAKKVKKCRFIDKKAASGSSCFYHVRAYSSLNHTRTGIMSSKKFRTVTRVYVETGHGTGLNGVWDSGCTWNGYQEAKLMIPIAKATAKYLEKSGVYVYTDAWHGNDRNLNYTLAFLNSHSVSAFLNIHCDAAFEAAGTLPLYRTHEQKKLAKALNRGVHEYVKIRNRGLERRTDLETLNSGKVHCAACLFETGNIKKDNRTLRKKADAIGKGLAKGTCDYLGLEFME